MDDQPLRRLAEILADPWLLSDADFEWLVCFARQRRGLPLLGDLRAEMRDE